MDKDIHMNFSTSIIQSVLFCGDAIAPLLFSLSLSLSLSVPLSVCLSVCLSVSLSLTHTHTHTHTHTRARANAHEYYHSRRENKQRNLESCRDCWAHSRRCKKLLAAETFESVVQCLRWLVVSARLDGGELWDYCPRP